MASTLLLEPGSSLLLEAGSFLLLEPGGLAQGGKAGDDPGYRRKKRKPTDIERDDDEIMDIINRMLSRLE